jgi:hypothetical protein
VLALLLEDQANCTLPDLCGVLAPSSHGSILSTVGASENPGAVHLLKEDAEKPLALDTLVWPNPFGDGMFETLATAPLAAPSWRGPNSPLWEDLAALRALLHSTPTLSPYEVIAVTWLAPEDVASGVAGPHREPTRPAERDSAWEFLGYDVADGAISGLTNCGYTDDEPQAARARWVPLLNESHLFARAEDAFDFAAYSDVRVPEHAPFSVFGLWRVQRSYEENHPKAAQ